MAKTTKPEALVTEPRPYLKSVHLRNAPPLRDVKASFQPGLNIIIGPNGAGKTQFMRLVSELVELFEEKHRGEGCSIVIGGTGLDLEISIQPMKNSKGGLNNFRPSRGSGSLAVVAKNEIGHGQGNNIWDAGDGVSSLPEYFVVPVWHGLPVRRLLLIDMPLDVSINDSGVFRILNISQEEQGVSVLSELLINALVPYDTKAIDKQFMRATDVYVKDFIRRSVDENLSRINFQVSSYTPIRGVRLSNQMQVYRDNVNREIIVKGLAIEYNVEGDWLPFSVLSDGTKRMFYVISELAASHMSVPSLGHTTFTPVDYDKIILLEEPELGIHPKQLHKLLQFIREVSKENQVILTTHSPQTLDMLTTQELDRITICDYVPGKGTQMRKLSADKKKKARAYLKDKGFLSEFWRFSNLESPN